MTQKTFLRATVMTGLLLAVSAQAITPVQVLEKAAETWKDIHDYSATFRQENTDSGSTTIFLGEISFCRLPEQADKAYLRLDYFTTTTNEEPGVATVVRREKLQDQYFSDGDTLWHYEPLENQVTVESIDMAGAFPEILLLAGFLKVDPNEFGETHTLKPVVTESFDGHEAYRLSIEPKGESKAVEPLRSLWLDRETLLPVRVRTEQDTGASDSATWNLNVSIEISRHKINQGLTPQQMTPQIPSDAARIDKRPPEARGTAVKSGRQTESMSQRDSYD
ncbi:MAG TPA: hypothetical protein PLG59_01295 [bacterium]|nr:hypothetical protein [bacterium]HQO33265.1 hypothetical protein [bacterium]HQP99782.1 hypothetical protein [bacterium]